MKKSNKAEREKQKLHRKESKKKQENVLQELAQIMVDAKKTVNALSEEIEEIEDFSGFVQEESTTAGRVLSDLMYSFTNDLAIGKLIKSGEIRKKVVDVEVEWKVPDGYNMTHFDMENFSMKFLTKAVNPRLDKVVLQLHGGGYIAKIRNIYYTFAVYYCDAGDGIAVLSPDYRVAPEDPYPAALEDAIASYQWLLDRGWKGEQIILAGDSAGGGLAMALTMYLRDHEMPLPCGIVAMSPWTDVTASGESYSLNYELDPLFGNTKESMIYVNDYPGEHDKKDPYISPIFGNFREFPPMLIQVGSTEMLLSDSITAAGMADIAGVEVRLSIYDDMFHVFQMSGMILPESKKAWEEVGQFIQLLLNK